jgi:hypothetical protein
MMPDTPVRSPAPIVRRSAAARYQWDWWWRGVLVGGGLVLIGLLATASWLEPSRDGYGTHRQLGLPACSFMQMVGCRCPSCGMTTSWAYLMRGNVWGSLSVNTGGTLLGVIALVTGPWLLVSGLRGRWVGSPPHELVVIGMCVVMMLVILTDWLLRLYAVV